MHLYCVTNIRTLIKIAISGKEIALIFIPVHTARLPRLGRPVGCSPSIHWSRQNMEVRRSPVEDQSKCGIVISGLLRMSLSMFPMHSRLPMRRRLNEENIKLQLLHSSSFFKTNFQRSFNLKHILNL